MSDFNSQHNRAVWFDIPVADLDRARRFYTVVLGVIVHQEQIDGLSFCVLDHAEGNGGCLVPRPEQIGGNRGVLLYLNVDGRIRDAVRQVGAAGGQVLEDVHTIGPHGCRAVVLDSEGNRIALHSTRDA
jgi:predicted enzyme related to lactoylglutathione lyase